MSLFNPLFTLRSFYLSPCVCAYACVRCKKEWNKYLNQKGLAAAKQWHAAQFSFRVLWIGSSLNNPKRPLNWLKLIHGQFAKNKSTFIIFFLIHSFFRAKSGHTRHTYSNSRMQNEDERGMANRKQMKWLCHSLKRIVHYQFYFGTGKMLRSKWSEHASNGCSTFRCKLISFERE